MFFVLVYLSFIRGLLFKTLIVGIYLVLNGMRDKTGVFGFENFVYGFGQENYHLLMNDN